MEVPESLRCAVQHARSDGDVQGVEGMRFIVVSVGDDPTRDPTGLLIVRESVRRLGKSARSYRAPKNSLSVELGERIV